MITGEIFVKNKKKLVLVSSKKMADELVEEGFNYMIQHLDNNTEAYAFIETDALYKILNSKGRFSRKNWTYAPTLNF